MSQPILSILSENSQKMKIHLIGVAGSGMSGLASLLLKLGHNVSGSDRVSTEETKRLEENGLVFSSPHSRANILGVDLICYSSAIKAGNELYDRALKEEIPMARRAEVLAAVMKLKKGIVVAGTHGKTTTSSMIAHVLRLGELNPAHYVGAEIPILGTNAEWNDKGDLFVVEGDESDGTLAYFQPQQSVILNIEEEHLDFYSNLSEIEKVFSTLINQTQEEIIYCGEDTTVSGLLASREKKVSYGWSDQFDFYAKIKEVSADTSCFEVYSKEGLLGEVTLGVPGKHNILNSLSAIAIAVGNEVSFDKISNALSTFRGAKRRFELKYLHDDYTVIDDYAHHPTEIQATLATAKALESKRRIVVFQPHRYSRTQLLKDDFAISFDDCDYLIVTDIYPASERPLPGVTGQTIVDAVKAKNHNLTVKFIPELTEARLEIGQILEKGDLVLTLGAGSIHEIATKLARDLAVKEGFHKNVSESECEFKLYEPMLSHCTMKVGGPCQYWISPTTVDAYAGALSYFRKNKTPIRVIGRGSNLLIKDGGIKGAVICPSKGEFEKIEVTDNLMEIGAGVRLKKVSATAAKAGIGGFEWMEGIPGAIGGSVRMNAGAIGIEMFDQIVSVKFIDTDGEIKTKTNQEIEYHYRNVPEFTDCYVVSVVMKGDFDDISSINEKIEASKNKRKTSQPIAASAGCIFKNPNDIPAGKLVQELGMKEVAIGGATVSEIHGNFIVNKENATADNILNLIEKIQKTAFAERGIELDTEVQIIGDQNISF